MPRRLSTAKLLDRIYTSVDELRRYGAGTQWIMLSQVEDHIGVSGVEVQRDPLGAETGRLDFAGVAAHSSAVRWQPAPSTKPPRRKATKKRG
jgi:hypothetical protein